jgi:hypothetical protein
MGSNSSSSLCECEYKPLPQEKSRIIQVNVSRGYLQNCASEEYFYGNKSKEAKEIYTALHDYSKTLSRVRFVERKHVDGKIDQCFEFRLSSKNYIIPLTCHRYNF